MQDEIASRTALRVAVRRAEHQVLDKPRVFEDHLSLSIIGPEAASEIRPGRVNRRQRLSPSFRAYMAARSRFAEDELASSVQNGVLQYVILGAGLDTFGYRNPHAAAGLRVFEVDHPATQAWKRERLESAGIAIPAGTTLVPADFENHSLAEVLDGTGFRVDRPAFCSWLGVTPYLTEKAFEQTLAFVAALPPGSGIVFDYALPREGMNEVQRMAFDALAARVEAAGEPFRLFHYPEELRRTLHRLGFSRLEDLGEADLNSRYFSGRADGLRIRSRLARLISASL